MGPRGVRWKCTAMCAISTGVNRNRTAAPRRPDEETGTQPDGAATRSVRTERDLERRHPVGHRAARPRPTSRQTSVLPISAPLRRTGREGGAMRSLAAQLVALALAVPVAAVASSHANSSHWSTSSSHLIFRTPLIEQPAKHRCHAYCQARKLRHQLRRVHGRTVALARRAALPDAPVPSPRLAALLAARAARGARRTYSAATAPRPRARCACGSRASGHGSASTATRRPGTTPAIPTGAGCRWIAASCAPTAAT